MPSLEDESADFVSHRESPDSNQPEMLAVCDDTPQRVLSLCHIRDAIPKASRAVSSHLQSRF